MSNKFGKKVGKIAIGLFAAYVVATIVCVTGALTLAAIAEE